MNPSDMAVVAAISRGKAAELDGLGLQPDWIADLTVRAVVSAAINLSRQSKQTNLAQVLAVSHVSGPAAREVVQIWTEQTRLNGTGDVDAALAVEAAGRSYQDRALTAIRHEIDQLHRESPDEIRKWLPIMVSKLASIVTIGATYDSRPSAHMLKPVPQIRIRSLIPELGHVLRGGYRDGAFMLYAGLSKHGKTTTLITHACDLVAQSKRVVIVNNENAEQKFVARVIRGLSGLSEEEIATRNFKALDNQTPAERKAIYDSWMVWCDEYLSVYGFDYYNDRQIERLVKWHKPDALLIDYLDKQSGMFSGDKGMRNDPVGDFSHWLLDLANTYAIHVVTAGQLSAEYTRILTTKDDSNPVPLYGSVRPGQKADVYSLLKRDPHTHNMAYFRVYYDRLTNKQDTIHRIPFDPHRWTLEFPVILGAQKYPVDTKVD